MIRPLPLPVLALVAGLAASPVHAGTTVQVVETDPPGDAVTLARNQNYHLRLHYESDRPVRIWVRPYFRGKAVQAGSNPSRVHPAGSGEALGWLFLFNPGTRVDEVRITAGDGSLAGTPVVAVHRVTINGGAQPGAGQAAPEWVTRLRALDTAAQKRDYDKRMSEPVSAGDTALLTGFMLGMLAVGICGFAAPAWGLRRWRGGWRIASAVPAALMAFVVLRIVFDTARDPTSHNLWPFEVLIAGALSTAIMIGLAVARRFARTA